MEHQRESKEQGRRLSTPQLWASVNWVKAEGDVFFPSGGENAVFKPWGSFGVVLRARRERTGMLCDSQSRRISVCGQPRGTKWEKRCVFQSSAQPAGLSIMRSSFLDWNDIRTHLGIWTQSRTFMGLSKDKIVFVIAGDQRRERREQDVLGLWFTIIELFVGVMLVAC